MTKAVLALDQGTTSSRAIVFGEDARVLAVAQRELTQHYPQPGWVEHDPEELWSTQMGVAQEALSRAGLRAADLSAIGITNQRETTLLWERKSGRALHPAVVWQDRRTAPLCERLRAQGHEDMVRAKTGLLLDPYFSATKLNWLLENVPDAQKRAEAGELAFGTVDSWLLYNLTGGEVHATDASNASRTLLYNIHTGEWDDELLGLFGIPRAVLPQVRPSCGVYGETAAGLLGSRVPIAGVAGDQQAATFGQGCVRRGMVKSTYGTGCFMLMNTEDKAVISRERLLSTVAWELDGGRTYALEGSVFVGGAVVGWLQGGLGVIRHASEVDALAGSVPDAGGVFLVPAFTGLGAPHWDPHARGTITGLTRGSTAAHLARAALEAIAFQSAELLLAMERDAVVPVRELRVDGGASRSDLTMQFQADILGIPVRRAAVTETTALGAALLAGRAVDLWKGAPPTLAPDRVFEPRMAASERETRLAGWRRAVERSRDWATEESE